MVMSEGDSLEKQEMEIKKSGCWVWSGGEGRGGASEKHLYSSLPQPSNPGRAVALPFHFGSHKSDKAFG